MTNTVMFYKEYKMAETGDRAAQDIGGDEAYTTTLQSVTSANVHITTASLNQAAIERAAINASTLNQMNAINAETTTHMKTMNQIIAEGARQALLLQGSIGDKVLNVDEQALAVKDLYADPAIEAIGAQIADAVLQRLAQTAT